MRIGTLSENYDKYLRTIILRICMNDEDSDQLMEQTSLFRDEALIIRLGGIAGNIKWGGGGRGVGNFLCRK